MQIRFYDEFATHRITVAASMTAAKAMASITLKRG